MMSFIFPFNIAVLAPFLNGILPKLPGFRHLCLVQWMVAKPLRVAPWPERSVTVVIPTRNEVGNIRPAVERVPQMGLSTEIIFVDGASTDGTIEEIEAVIRECPGKVIRLLHQISQDASAGETSGANSVPVAKQKMLRLGKGDAVRKGFAAASGDVLMILDADLTVPPEDLPRFYYAIRDGKGELVNGTRLVYPMEDEAMKTLNLFGNKLFSLIFTWLLGQRIKDTLCGTKVLSRENYQRIVDNRSYFGDFDPFGDFDLLFGAARLKMHILDMPVRYRRRISGYSKVETYKHGKLLLRMSAIAFQRFKLAPLLGREQ
jgi:glycosyltransferase involved in cell wall biosynthesis